MAVASANFLNGSDTYHEAASHRLTSHGWLSQVEPEIAGRMLDMAVWRKVPEGTAIYRIDDETADLFGIVSGQVIVSHGRSNLDAQYVHMFRTGQWFGFAPVLSRARRRVQCIARSECHLAILPKRALRSFLDEHPAHWHAFALLVDIQSDSSALAGIDLLRRRQEERLAAVLLRFAGCRLANNPDGPPWQIAMTQVELAEASNMSRNSASRLLVDMERQGLVALQYGNVSVLDPDRLRAELQY